MLGRCLCANGIDTPQQRLELTETELRSFHTAVNGHICNLLLGGDKYEIIVILCGNSRYCK